MIPDRRGQREAAIISQENTNGRWGAVASTPKCISYPYSHNIDSEKKYNLRPYRISMFCRISVLELKSKL